MPAFISIKNLGAIRSCQMQVDDFIVITGEQATGKSTIAKCIYLCRTIKDDVYHYLMRTKYLEDKKRILRSIKSDLRIKFLRIFGTSLAMSADMELQYWYDEKASVRFFIKKRDEEWELIEKFVEVQFSKELEDGLNSLIQRRDSDIDLIAETSKLFCDEYQTVFIPAGRSLITLLTSQLNYLYATMDDQQKRMMDYTTQQYIEFILKIRPSFANGLEGSLTDLSNEDRKTGRVLIRRINEILKGRYEFHNGKELLYLINDDDLKDRYVKLNFTSSGQQETVWILNIIFYLFISHTKAFLIVEEPEAHLYPNAQKKISELLVFMHSLGFQMMLTTHSPYVLGAVNNMKYAAFLAENKDIENEVYQVIPRELTLSSLAAYYVSDGTIDPCLEDMDGQLIDNTVIDGASIEINEDYDKLFDLFCQRFDEGEGKREKTDADL